MSLVSYGHNRIFIDIAYSGCGSDCKYCYVETASKPQSLIENEDEEKIVKTLLSISDLNNKIVSFSPNTEPFKSEKSSEIVIRIIEKIVCTGVRIQISTKEKIMRKFLEKLNNLSIMPGQIVINVSMPLITDIRKLEKNTSEIKERLKNFVNIADLENIICCLYIKPFMSSFTYYDLKKYIKIIKKYKIKYVCIGMMFFKNGIIEPCMSYYNESTMNEIIKKNNMDIIYKFSNEIRINTESKIVYSTTCVFPYYGFRSCSAKFYIFNSILCNECKLRKDIY